MRSFGLTALLLTVLLGACGNAPEHDGHEHEGEHAHDADGSHPGEHGPELEPLVFTLYTEKTELFVEFKPLVVGQSSRFAAHFTKLGDVFLPFTEGTVTVTLEAGGSTVTATADAPSSVGIFKPEIVPTKTGGGRLIFEVTCKEYSDRFVIENVMVHPTAEDALASAEPEGPGATVPYLKEQQWKIEFATVLVQPRDFHDVLNVGGELRSIAANESVITAPASGIVRFAAAGIAPGVSVNDGQALLVLSGGGMAEGNIDSEYRKAKAEFDQARSDMERADALIGDKIISQKEYGEIKNRFGTAQVRYNTLGAGRSGDGLRIAAPIGGYIRSINVRQGQFVEAGQPLMTVARNGRMVLVAHVPQREVQRLPAITGANFRAGSSAIVFDTEQLNGKVLAYGRGTSGGGLLPVSIEVDDPDNVMPGAFADVWLKSAAIPNALVVPMSALIEEQGTYSVYVQVEGEAVEKHVVTLGANDGLNVQVLSGVNPGERVVSKGAFQIKLATMSGAMPAHGHEH